MESCFDCDSMKQMLLLEEISLFMKGSTETTVNALERTLLIFRWFETLKTTNIVEFQKTFGAQIPPLGHFCLRIQREIHSKNEKVTFILPNPPIHQFIHAIAMKHGHCLQILK